jgi:hypothetical protein
MVVGWLVGWLVGVFILCNHAKQTGLTPVLITS